MTDIKGIDFAWQKPTPQQVKNAGAHWIAGYISNDPTKDLNVSQVHEYSGAGLPVVLVDETTATRALAGMHAGIYDAQRVTQRLSDLSMKDAVVYFAVDTDATWAQVEQYFQGIFNQWQSKRKIGVYGGIHVIEGAYNWGLKYLWQTVAWSGGIWSPHTTIRQEGGELFGGTADWDDATAQDWGQWPHLPVVNNTVKYEENDVLAYFEIPANTPRDIPVEPAGTDSAPKGGAKNGQAWLSAAPSKGENGTLKVTYHTYTGGWSKTFTETPISGDGDKWGTGLPTDGSVDKIRIESTVDVTVYIVGRQVQ